MLKATKYLIIYFAFFFILTPSCAEKGRDSVVQKSECEQIKDVITDCLGLHRGALGYLDNCGSISLDIVESLNSCEEKLDYINIRD